ncbi:S41 family peptidase [Deinococcus pimensis]|uniref:S41 family peptidase n=1 Tax=Deinococcus pimensis TaxID=309888 RepID=UPI0004859979|nr:S41 family peptidase [Deinococcus pimensis]
MTSRLLALAAATASLSLSAASATSPAQTVFNEVADLVRTQYGGLSTVDRPALIAGAQKDLDAACQSAGETCAFNVAWPIIDKLVSNLGDEHSFFQRPEAFGDFKARSSGGSRLQYGIKLANLADGQQVVTEIVPGSSAEEVGIRRGDRLVKLDGQKYTYDLLRESRSKGSPITLEAVRGDQTLSFRITARVSTTRDLPRIEYVNDVAVIRIPTFIAGGGVAQGVHDLVREAKAKAVRGILVDLRDNGGGDLRECDLSISAFVPSFTRVARTSGGDEPTTVAGGAYRSGRRFMAGVRDPQRWDGPMAVLVNKASASCSEFFAREIQYAKRGPIVGEATAGVGNTATLVYPLSGDAALQLTTVNYGKPDGSAYPTRVTPEIAGSDDYELLARGTDVLLQKGIEAVRASTPAATAR